MRSVCKSFKQTHRRMRLHAVVLTRRSHTHNLTSRTHFPYTQPLCIHTTLPTTAFLKTFEERSYRYHLKPKTSGFSPTSNPVLYPSDWSKHLPDKDLSQKASSWLAVNSESEETLSGSDSEKDTRCPDLLVPLLPAAFVLSCCLMKKLFLGSFQVVKNK